MTEGPGSPGGSAADSDFRGLYVHVPFCLTRCPYCDFASEACERVPPDFVDTLLREADYYACSLDGEPAVDTIYVGGGTPSRLAPEEVRSLFQGLRQRIPLDAVKEVTFEVNPDDVTTELLGALLESGVTRVSLGVQSLFDEELRWLKRRHDAAAALEAFRQIQSAGFQTAVDLMYGLPGATVSRWDALLGEVLRAGPHHISSYQLTVEPNTPLGKRRATGETVTTSEGVQRDLFLATSARLREAGYEHYEVSNFALRGGHRSLHNQKYWHHVPYLGLGPAAHSYRGRRRWWNHRAWEKYRASVLRVGSGVIGGECLRDDQLRMERLMLGLRLTEGLPVSFLASLRGGPLALAGLCEQGLLVVREGRAAPTALGLLIADRLPLYFATSAARGA